MLKLLIPACFVLIILSIAGYFIFFRPTTAPFVSNLNQAGNLTSTNESTDSATVTDYTTKALVAQVSNLDDAAKKINDLENRVKTLENTNADILAKLGKLEQSNPGAVTTLTNTTSSSTATPPQYIPLNFTGSVSTSTWTNLTTGTINIDPASYPGYKNMYLIAGIQVYQGQGTAYARLVNTANGAAVLSSQVSTTSQSYTSVTSSAFQLPSGSNPYTLQLMTQTPGYPASVQSAYIMVQY